MFGGAPRGPNPRALEADERQAAQQCAYERGLAEGREEARIAAEQSCREEIEARGKIGEAFALIEEQCARIMADRLREAAVALCTRTLAPLELDEEMLVKRIDKLIAMVGEAEKRLIRVNPADLAFLADRLRDQLLVEGDPALPRGSIRLETAEGGIDDGPDVWRRAIEEALRSC